MKLVKYFLQKKSVTLLLLVLILAGGLFSYIKMGKLEDAPFTIKQALVLTPYPGASPSEVQSQVTDILEESIQSLSELYYLKTENRAGLSKITVYVKKETRADEMQQLWDKLRRKVNDVQSKLPDGAGPSVVNDDFGDVLGVFYGLTGNGHTYRELEDEAKIIKNELLKVKDVAKVEIYGVQTPTIDVSVSPSVMAQSGITTSDIVRAFEAQNKVVDAGGIDAGQNRLRIESTGNFYSLNDIRNLTIVSRSGEHFRLADIAQIEESYQTPASNLMRINDQPAIGIAISTVPTGNVVDMAKAVKDRIDKLSQSMPEGYELTSIYDQGYESDVANQGFILNLIISVLTVIAILLFFIGFKNGTLIGSGLIFSIFATLIVMMACGIALQRMSLAAIIIAMGMLVDNAIVILDGIQVDMQRGIERRTALTGIGRKTAMPLLGATLIAILAFFPIFLSPDTAGIYVRDLFIVLAVSLLLSWILALTLVPVLADKRLKVKGNREGDPYGNSYYRALRSVLNWVLSHRIVSLCVGFGLVAVSLLCFRTLPQGFFPDMDYDQLYIEYKLPEGTNSTQVGEDLHAIENYLLGRSEITHVTTSIGGTPSRYNLVRSIADPSLAYGELIVDYTSPEALTASFDEIQTYLNANYPDAYVRLKRYNLMYKKFPIEVEFSGPDPAVLRDLTAQAAAIMEESPSLQMVTSDWEPKVPVLIVDYNQPVARNIGLSRQDIGLSLMSATDGIPTGTFYEGTESKTIYMRCVDRDGNPIESLEHTPVFGLMPATAGLDRQTVGGLLTGTLSEEEVLASLLSTVPLSQAVNGVHVEWEEPVVIRRNGERAMRAQCIPVPGAAVENARASIAEQIASIELPEGYDMKWEGEKSASNESMKYLFKYYPLAVILMIAILIALFKDYRKPAIIVLCLPLLFIGVIFGMMLSGKTFGFVAIVATLGLVGMLIKNGIVLMDEITLQINAGKEPVDALMESSASRFRPVMLASLTTILGMIPLLGDSLFGPAAVVIMGGLLVGTLITLLFIPVLYALFYRIRIK